MVNPGAGYTNGEVVSTPYTGYEVNIYRVKYSKADNTLLSKELEGFSKYSNRNEIIFKVQEQPPEPIIPEPSVPDVTGPDTTVPDTTVPDTTVPDTTVPDTTVPDTTVPDTTVPEVTVPEVTVPEVTTEVTTP